MSERNEREEGFKEEKGERRAEQSLFCCCYYTHHSHTHTNHTSTHSILIMTSLFDSLKDTEREEGGRDLLLCLDVRYIYPVCYLVYVA